MDENSQDALRDRVLEAKANGTSLAIYAGNSKQFYGREIVGEPCCISHHQGVVDYQPAELVLTARAGTPLLEINALLAEQNQVLGFDPPLFSPQATLGGAIACGLSGPGRPFAGSVQDFILGIKLLSGRGEVLEFGGQVIKNVAGFDVSRLLAGSLGCLGIVLEVSLKVLPRHEAVATVTFEQDDANQSIQHMNELAAMPLPITAASWYDGLTRIRLSGTQVGIDAAKTEIGGDDDPEGEIYWQSIRDHSHAFFNPEQLLIKAVVPGTAPLFCEDRNQLIDWAGGCRWISTETWDDEFNYEVTAAHGHCTAFRNGDRTGEVFTLPDPPIMKLHHSLKQAFDPDGLLNPGRLYADL